MDSSLNKSDQILETRNYVDNKLGLFENILNSLESVSIEAKSFLKDKVSSDGKISNQLLEKHQHEGHGYAWFETYRIALRETLNWYKTLKESNKATKIESGILVFSFAEYLCQMRNGIMMSQTEVIRPENLGISNQSFSFCDSPDVAELIKLGLSETVKYEIVESLENGFFPNLGLNDETLEMIQDQFKKFTDEEIVPNANEWHLKDDLIPDEILKKMSELGVFSIAIPESYGGLGMGKVAMCVVTEELSRGFLAGLVRLEQEPKSPAS